MKCLLLKKSTLTAWLFTIAVTVFGQNKVFVPNAKKDSIWVVNSLTNANKPNVNNDTTKRTQKWITGKVLYSNDGFLKVTQLVASPDAFSATLQFNYHGKIKKQNLPYSDLSNFSLTQIYRLPDRKPAYLFLLSTIGNSTSNEKEWLSVFKNAPSLGDQIYHNHIKAITYVAVVFRLEKNSFVEVAVRPPALVEDDPVANAVDSALIANDQANTDTNSFGFASIIKGGKYPKPFLTYDPGKHSLSFLNIYDKSADAENRSDAPFLTVDSGAYQYRDTAFVLLKSTSHYYPSLKSVAKIVGRKIYKVGNYIIDAKAIEGYEEVYGAVIQPNLTKKYLIGTQTFTASNNEEWDKIDLNPNYRLQNNSSLIMLLMDEYNNYAPGACGSGSYYDSHFWLTDGKSSKQLFSFSTSSCTSRVDYSFTQNGKETSGSLYLTKPSGEDDDYELSDCYWKDAATYIFTVINSEKGLSRKFYLYFNVADKKTPVKFEPGKLGKIKTVPSN